MSAGDDLIRPLKLVETQFLQVLLTRFSLSRCRSGFQLSVEFNDDTKTISTGSGKSRVKEEILNFESESSKYQKQFEALLIENQGEDIPWNNENFRFRYASGGTLPILRMDGVDYYCLFYRDIFPIGWNIANGGCCTREELLRPVETIERELSEELVILDRWKKVQYIFKGDDVAPCFRPHRVARGTAWEQVLGGRAFDSLKKVQAPMKWMNGPDCLKVRIGDCDFDETTGCFLNINATDFGIEVDKVVKICVKSDVSIYDGEQTRNFILNRLVGLFEVEKLDDAVASGSENFIPDRFFYNGEPDGDADRPSLDACLGKMIERLKEVRPPEQKRYFADCRRAGGIYNLCPVTRSLVRRYASRERAPSAAERVKVFISYGGDDEHVAKEVNDFLKPAFETFFFMEHDYRDTLSSTIDKALGSAECLILVGTNLSNINRDRCAYEWKGFCREKDEGFKGRDSKVIPFIESKIDDRDLPPEIRDLYRERFQLASLKSDIQKLAKQIPDSLQRVKS